MNAAASRNIPESIKRQVRQECFFGCVICGMPVFHYDHIEEWSIVQEHTAENLALLCAVHHDAKTHGKLDVELVRERRQEPFNKGRQFTSGYNIPANRSVDVILGTNHSVSTFPPGGGIHEVIWINGYSFFRLHCERGWITMSFVITDDKGAPLVAVEDGELVISSEVWDYRYEGTRLQIRRAHGDVLAELDLSNQRVHILRGAFRDEHGDGFVVDENYLTNYIGKTPLAWMYRMTIHNCFSGSWAVLNRRVTSVDLDPINGVGYLREIRADFKGEL